MKKQNYINSLTFVMILSMNSIIAESQLVLMYNIQYLLFTK